MNEASVVPSKYCAACGGRYPGDALFCPTDGRPLQGSAGEREGADPYLGQEISGHIEIRQLVGVGAMGRVYRAFQRGIDRDVAVKILHRELSANAQLVSRFTREAKVASRLQHPNVVQVLLAGQLPNRAVYMVMEYLDGLSLQSALAAAGGALPLARALHVALQLCDAVGEAHAQGIVHRDLKPENVMLVRRGADPDFVKVLDFGIARINWGEQSVATAAGLIFGTARYISPEGAQGSAVGPASDVYSIGTLLYQMLSGRTPFDGDQAVGLLVQQIHDPAPALRSIPRAAYVPEPIAEAVMASLSKDPSTREPDARAFGHVLFDAAKAAGLSPDEFSRPLLRRESSPMHMAPVVATKQLDLAPKEAPARANGVAVDVGAAAPTAATVKWSPPTDFHTRLSNARASRPEHAPTVIEPEAFPRVSSRVDETLDDRALDLPERPASSPELTPASTLRRSSEPDVTRGVPRTVPGDAAGPKRTEYTPPAPAATSPPAPTPANARRTRGWPLVVVCFLLGALIAAAWAWKVGKIGGALAEEDRFVARATEAMFQKRFGEPPGDNVKDITDDGLRLRPNDPRLLDIRRRAADELTSQAIAHRAAGDVHEASKLARLALTLDAEHATAKRLVEQYERELAAAPPSAAPPLDTPPVVPAPSPKAAKSAAAPRPKPAARVEYTASVDASLAQPKLGQTVELVARITPNKGDFDAARFTVAGPGTPGGVRMPAVMIGPGVFKASYAFLEPGRFEITFTAQADDKPVSATRSITAVEVPPPVPTPTPKPAPSSPPPGNVKWM